AEEDSGEDGEEDEEREELGVEIEVTPAGKSTRKLSLLSGGEKSLVALAFVFAVFLARPCPFYILDEVEAALDDANIDRFLQLVRRFSDRAQFVIVTHQKRTMDAADVLYGVTMGGDGVTKVVSRRLPREVEDELDGAAPPNARASAESESEGRGVFRRLRKSLSKSRQALQAELSSTLFDKLDDETWERLEEALILADVGAKTTADVVGRLEHEYEVGTVTDGEALRERLVELLAEVAASDDGRIDVSKRPTLLMIVGVNGTGKTTTIGKLAWHLKQELGLSVIVAAADTYRAAAIEQLEVWAERAGVEIVRGSPSGDPGAVVFDAISAAESRGIDVVIADTAGRLHTKTNLMEELAKVRRVAEKRLDGAPHESLIVIDATTGQNGLRQAQAFAHAVDLTGVVLTKLDGTAKGGIALAIASELDLPVKLIGVGEDLEDLRPFDAREFAAALLGD
ncbi:MAG TPA: signal recognition particle-docking protein FtsY, partial [Solirubrobacterales bacterium]|nr:signal recognition particle-docking protein FtsY [Solirubrobacterales bacterium]